MSEQNTEYGPRPYTENELLHILSSPRVIDPYRVVFTIGNQTLDALELTLDHLRRVPDAPTSWKWVLIGLHSALHGSFCLAVSGTTIAPLLVPWQEWQFWERVNIERETGVPQNFVRFLKPGKRRSPEPPQIDTFLNLYEKVQQKHRMEQYASSQPLDPTAAQTESIKNLHRKRNELVLFSTITLVYDVPLMISMLIHCREVVQFLLTEAHPLDTITDHEEAARARRLIADIQHEIEAVRQRYESLAQDQ